MRCIWLNASPELNALCNVVYAPEAAGAKRRKQRVPKSRAVYITQQKLSLRNI